MVTHAVNSLEDHDIAFPRFPTVTSLMTFATAPWVIHLLSIGHLYTNQRLVKLIQKTAGSPSKLTVRCDFAASASPPIDSCSPEWSWGPGSTIKILYWKKSCIGKQESRWEDKSLKTNPPSLVSTHPSSYTWTSFLLFYSFLVRVDLRSVCSKVSPPCQSLAASR